MAKPLTSTPERQIGAEQFAALVRGSLTADNAADKAKESIKDRLAGAVENANLHRAAFNHVKKLAKMDEMKRNDFLAAEKLYLDYAKEKGLFGDEHVGDLMGRGADDDAMEAANEAAAAEAQVASNVQTLRRGIKKKDETAAAASAPVH